MKYRLGLKHLLKFSFIWAPKLLHIVHVFIICGVEPNIWLHISSVMIDCYFMVCNFFWFSVEAPVPVPEPIPVPICRLSMTTVLRRRSAPTKLPPSQGIGLFVWLLKKGIASLKYALMHRYILHLSLSSPSLVWFIRNCCDTVGSGWVKTKKFCHLDHRTPATCHLDCGARKELLTDLTKRRGSQYEITQKVSQARL